MKKVKSRKKTISGRIVLYLLALTTSLLSSARDFEYTYEGQTLTYTVLDEDTKTVRTNGYQKISGDLILPEHPKDGEIEYTLTEIGANTFRSCTSLTSTIIPNSVTAIGAAAFRFCTSLTSIVIPNSITTINELAFFNCNSLISIVIPNSVSVIGRSAFSACDNLKRIEVDSSNPNYSSIDGVLFNKNHTTIIGYPAGKAAEYTIPSSVIIIGENAFSNCASLKSIVIPNSVTTIGGVAFSDCASLTSIVIPNSVTTIGNNAFSNCSSLKSIEISNSVTSIGEYTFYYCPSLKSIEIPNSVTKIGSYAFQHCSSLTSIVIPNSVTSIGRYAFDQCSSLKSIIIPNSVTSIGEYAFSYSVNIVTCLSEEPPILGRSCFNEGRELLYVPKGALAKYQASDWAKYFKNIEELQDSKKIEISSTDSDVHISVNSNTVTISGLDSNEPVSVFDITGKVIYKGLEHQLTLKSGKVYILTTPANTYKIAL